MTVSKEKAFCQEVVHYADAPGFDIWILVPGVRCHLLDPSQTPEYSPSIRDRGISCKTIFDCTVPYPLKDKFQRSKLIDVDPSRFAPELFHNK